MDDRDLEARLRTHLHHRFDAAPVPAGLAASVREGMAPVAATRVGFRLRASTFQLGWATLAIALVVGAVVLFQNTLGPAAPGPTPTPAATGSFGAERQFIVLAPNLQQPDKGAASMIGDILDARMRALGYDNFTSAIGNAFLFIVPATGPSDGVTRRTLGANGVVAFVPLPAADYGEGKLEARVGLPLPKDEPALFGWEGIESATIGHDEQQRTTVVVTLTAAARDAFGAYSSAHAGESMAVLIDDIVALVPVINEPITNGQIELTGAGLPGGDVSEDEFRRAAAILVGGPVTAAWWGLFSPQTISADAATAIALALYPRATVEHVQLDARAVLDSWAATWNIQVGGDLSGGCPMLPPGATTCPPPEGSVTVIIDGDTGTVVGARPADT